jgi:polysaccharide pyruvyl transferase WcaK-like protein
MDSLCLAYGYGWRNSGDLAINQGSIECLNRLFPSARPRVVSMFPERSPEFERTARKLGTDGRRYELVGGPMHYDPRTQSTGEQAVHLAGDGLRYALDRSGASAVSDRLGTSMAADIRDADFLFYNGGNLVHLNRSLPYLLGVLYPLQVARKHGVPYAFLPHTFFDLEGRYRGIVRTLLEESEFVWTRDGRSYDYLTSEFSLSPPVRNGLDTAFFLADPDSERRERRAETPRVTLVPRLSTLGDTGALGDDGTETLVERTLETLSERGYAVDVTVQTKVEAEWVDRNREFLDDAGVAVFESYDPRELRAHYRETDVLVTMRLHAGIFALSVGTPSVGLYRTEWGPKTPGTWENLGIAEYALPVRETTVESLVGRCESLLDERAAVSRRIADNVADRKEFVLSETRSLLPDAD